MLFLDTSFIIALVNDNDKDHKKAMEILKSAPNIHNQTKIINNIVLMEVLNKLQKNYFINKREKIISFY